VERFFSNSLKGLILLLSLVGFLNNLSWGLDIKDHLSAKYLAIPQQWEVEIFITATDRGKWNVLNTLSAVKEGIEALEIPHKVIGYKIVSFKQNREKLFKGRIIVQFFLRSKSQIKELKNFLENLKGNYPFKYSISSVKATISPKEETKIELLLKEKILQEAQKMAEEYGKLLNKNCTISFISFKREVLHSITVKGEKLFSSNGKGIEIKISAEVTFKCQ